MTAGPPCTPTPSSYLPLQQKSALQTEPSHKKCTACLQRRPHHHHAEHQQQRLPQLTVTTTASTSSTLQQRSPELLRRSSVSSLRSTGSHGTTASANKAPCPPSPLRPSSRASLSHATPKSTQPPSRSSSMSRSCNSPSISLADRPRWVGTWSNASSAFPSYSPSASCSSSATSAHSNHQSSSSSLSSPLVPFTKSVQRRQSMPATHASYSSSTSSSPSCATSTTPTMRRSSASKIGQSQQDKACSDKESGRGRSLETGKRKEDQDRQDAARYKAAAARAARGQEILQGISPQLLQPSCLPQPGQQEPALSDMTHAESRADEAKEENEIVKILVGDDEDYNGDSISRYPPITTATITSETTPSRSSTPSPTRISSPLRWSTSSAPTLAPALIRRFSRAEGSMGGPGSIAPPVVDTVQCQDSVTKIQETPVGEAALFRRRSSLAVDQYPRDVSPARQLFPRLWDTRDSCFGPHNDNGGCSQRNAEILREQHQQQQQQQQRRQSVGCLRDILVRKGSRSSLLSSPFVGRSDSTGTTTDHPVTSSASTILPPPVQPHTTSNCSSIESFPRITRERASSSSLRMQFIRDLFVATANSFSGSSETIPSEEVPQEKVYHSRRNSVSSGSTAGSAATSHSSNSGSSSNSSNSSGVFLPVLQRLPRLRMGTSGSMDSPLRSCVTSSTSDSSTAPSTSQVSNRNASPTASNASSTCPSPILRLMKSITNLKGVPDNDVTTLPARQTQAPSPGIAPSTQSDSLLLSGGEQSTISLPKTTGEPSVSSELDLNWTLLKRQLQLQQHRDSDDVDDDDVDYEGKGAIQQQGSKALRAKQSNQSLQPLQHSQRGRLLHGNSEPLYSPTIVNEIWSSNNLKGGVATKSSAGHDGATKTPDLVSFQNYYGEAATRSNQAEGHAEGGQLSSMSSDDDAAAAWTSWATIMQADRARWAESLARTAATNVQLKLNPNREKLEPHQLALPPLLFSSSPGECHRISSGDADSSFSGSLIIRDFYGIERAVEDNDDNEDEDEDEDEEPKAETVKFGGSTLIRFEQRAPCKPSVEPNVVGYSEKGYRSQSNGPFTLYSRR